MSIELDLQQDYPNFQLDLQYDQAASGITAVMGHSGAGKSAMMRAIAGLQPCTGRVSVAGTVWQDTQQGIFVPTHQRKLAYVFQNANLFPHLTVQGNALFGYQRAKHKRLQPEDIFEALSLTPLLSRTIHSLSGGERQRVALARSLLSSPELLIMDEALSSLDHTSRLALLGSLETLLKALAIPVFYISHQHEEVLRLADLVVVIEQGRVKQAGEVMDVVSEPHSPFVAKDRACSMLCGQFEHWDAQYQMACLQVEGQALWLTMPEPLEAQKEYRVVLMARDVSLSLSAAKDSSILNVLSCRVDSLQNEGASHVLARLAMGQQSLMARLTRKSAERMALQVGMPVFAQIKSVAIAR